MGAGLSSWHLTFYVLVAIAAGAVVSDEPAALQRGARGVLVVAYALVGRHAVDEDRAVAGYGCLAILSAATGLVTLALLYRLRESSEPATGIAFQMLLAFVFPILMGVWLRTIIVQGQRRSALLDERPAAHDELGRTQHAAAVTAERERVACEIHDTLAPGFTSIAVLTQTVSADLERRPRRDLRDALSRARHRGGR